MLSLSQPQRYPYTGADIELFLIDLRIPVETSDWQVLSRSELQRSEGFLNINDREHYVKAHAGLRKILSNITGQSAHSLEFSEGAFGKPRLEGGSSLTFNMAHSNGWALVAVCRNSRQDLPPEVGVDMEAVSAFKDQYSLINEICTEVEKGEILSLPTPGLTQALFVLWTRKEACLKALGVGLQLEPKSFHVGHSSIPIHTTLHWQGEPQICRLESVSLPVDGLVASVAVLELRSGS